MATAVITGANRGIGLALTEAYLASGYEVYAVCRNSSDRLNSTRATVIDGVDVTNISSLQALANKLDGVQIDVLINNAGVLRDEQFGHLNFGSIEEQFQVNTLGPLKVTEALSRHLGEGAKIALITSRMGSIEDNTSGGRYGYRMSKAALNAAGKSLAHDLKARNISVAILHPGFVQTDMVGGHGDISAETAAERLKKRIDELNLETSGTFWHGNGEQLPW